MAGSPAQPRFFYPPIKKGIQMSDPLKTLQQQIREQQAQNPHIAAQIASSAILQRLFEFMSDDKGVHVESVFAALGTLAGHACQQIALDRGLTQVSDNAGNRYYYGEALNRVLLEGKLSVWSLVGGAVQSHGGKLPDIREIVAHTTESIGTEQFGQPRLPEGHPIRCEPKQCLVLWQPLKQKILDVLPVPKSDWALAYALAIQDLIDQAAGIIPPELAARIVMECAVPMSKLAV